MSKEIKELLLKDINYARNSMSRELLYEVHGELVMAATLKGITIQEFLEMDAMVIRDGINNRDFIKVWDQQYWAHGTEISEGLSNLEKDILGKYRNSITRKAFQKFILDVKILLGMHVPATPLSEFTYADTDSFKEV